MTQLPYFCFSPTLGEAFLSPGDTRPAPSMIRWSRPWSHGAISPSWLPTVAGNNSSAMKSGLAPARISGPQSRGKAQCPLSSRYRECQTIRAPNTAASRKFQHRMIPRAGRNGVPGLQAVWQGTWPLYLSRTDFGVRTHWMQQLPWPEPGPEACGDSEIHSVFIREGPSFRNP